MPARAIDIEDLGHAFDPDSCRDIQERMLIWYDKNRRLLPWRGDSMIKTEKKTVISPYGIWVSEVMAQQTRIETVVKYYATWMEKFPNIKALADATPEDVNAVWAGLGYYRRARMLHSGAKYVIENYDGALPSDKAELLKIPGIGPYTAGAIASIAFNQSEPVVDGNVIRVLSRLRAVYSDPKNTRFIKYCWEKGAELIDQTSRPGDFNQSIMELGATVCTPKVALCDQCPVASHCHAFQIASGRIRSENHSCPLCDVDEEKSTTVEVTKYPRKAPRIKQREEVYGVCVISDNDYYLLVKRPATGLLAGQWEFPSFKLTDGTCIPEYPTRQKLCNGAMEARFGKDFVAELLESSARTDKGSLTHIFSHIKHHMGIESIETRKINVPDEIGAWMTIEQVHGLGLTTGMRKVLGKVVLKKIISKRKRAVAAVCNAVRVFEFGSPVFFGSGCRADSIRMLQSSDNLKVSVIFDDYHAKTSNETLRDRKSCHFAVPMNITSGYSVGVVNAQYNGLAYVPDEADLSARFNAEFFSLDPVVVLLYPESMDQDISVSYQSLKIFPKYSSGRLVTVQKKPSFG